MRRRMLLAGLSTSAALAACARREGAAGTGAGARSGETFRWKMVTTWPPNFPGVGTGVNEFAKLLEDCSAGRLRVKVYGAGELVPAFEVFDAVSRGTAELGHGVSYYWKGKSETASLFTAVPFGMTATEMNAWLYYGGGWELWKEVYAPFGLLPAPCGNSGSQMGGWFNKEINSVADLKGLKMRLPGLGGEVLARAGATPVTLAGSEIFTALQTGAIDAAEWIGPYNDLAFGLFKAAKYYYYPGWHEPAGTLEAIVNKRAFDTLPADLQAIVLACCRAVNDSVLAEYNARSAEALEQLVNVHKVVVRPFPDEVLKHLHEISLEIMREIAAKDPLFAKTYESVHAFQQRIARWTLIADYAAMSARSL